MRSVLVAAAVAAVPVAATAGTITGSVRFDGTPPERAVIRRDTDPYCNQGEASDDAVIVTNGKLKDVLVRVKRGARPAVPAASAVPAVPARCRL